MLKTYLQMSQTYGRFSGKITEDTICALDLSMPWFQINQRDPFTPVGGVPGHISYTPLGNDGSYYGTYGANPFNSPHGGPQEGTGGQNALAGLPNFVSQANFTGGAGEILITESSKALDVKIHFGINVSSVEFLVAGSPKLTESNLVFRS